MRHHQANHDIDHNPAEFLREVEEALEELVEMGEVERVYCPNDDGTYEIKYRLARPPTSSGIAE